MKKAITLNVKDLKININNNYKIIIMNRLKLILAVLSVFGLWCGTRIFISEQKAIDTILLQYADIIKEQSLGKLFVLILIINLLPIIISFLNGFFAFGTPLTIISPFLSCIFIGIFNTWTFSSYRLNGVFFSLLSVVPFSVIIMILLIISSNESSVFSKRIARSVFMYEIGDRGEVKTYFSRQAVIICVTVVLSFLQTIILKALWNKLLLA